MSRGSIGCWICYCLLSLVTIEKSSISYGQESMPTSWYTLPEHAREKGIDEQRLEEPTKEFELAVEELIKIQGDTYDHMLKESNHREKAAHSPGWELAAIRSQLALTAGGTLGLLALEGSVASELRWYKKNQVVDSGKFCFINDSEDAIVPPSLTHRSSNDSISLAVEEAVGAAYRSGKIKKKTHLLNTLIKEMRSTRDILKYFYSDTSSSWQAYRVRQAFIVDAAGNILGFAHAGGELTFEFEWNILEIPRDSFKHGDRSKSMHPATRLIRSLSSDLQAITNDKSLGSSWYLRNVQFFLGNLASGNLGIGKLSLGRSARVFFRKKPLQQKKLPFIPQVKESIPTISMTKIASPSELAYAESHGIDFRSSVEKSARPKDLYFFKLSRRSLRLGLKKANQIGAFFVKKAMKNQHKNWLLREVRSDFQLSITGGLGISTLQGTGDIRLEYAHKDC